MPTSMPMRNMARMITDASRGPGGGLPRRGEAESSGRLALRVRPEVRHAEAVGPLGEVRSVEVCARNPEDSHDVPEMKLSTDPRVQQLVEDHVLGPGEVGVESAGLLG